MARIPARFRLMLGDLWQDLRYSVRASRKHAGFTAAAIAMLALGIGATTAIFSVVNGVLLSPLPYPQPHALVRIVHSIGGIDQPYFNDAVFVTYEENTRTLEDIGVWIPGATATITGLGAPEEVRALRASRGVLTTLGVRPAIGRWFSEADDTPGAADAVMLSNGYWHRRFGGDAAVLEQSLTVDARPHRIVGVMPAGFRFTGEHDVILPLRINRGRLVPSFRLLGVARLKRHPSAAAVQGTPPPDVALAEANADAGGVLRTWLTNAGQHDPAFQARYRPALRPLKQDVVGDVGRTLWILMGTIGIVLLLACANVANLLLVRAEARRGELAIRVALGARWTRIARQLLVDCLLLAIAGGAFGVAVAYGGLRLLVALEPTSLPRLAEVSINPAVLGFALATSLTSGLLFGLVPILKHSRPRIRDVIGASGGGASPTRTRLRSQQALVAVQVALALVLLVSAGLMIRSFQALRRVDPGFTEPHRVQTFSVSIAPTVVAEPERVTRMQHEILNRIAAIPGVASAAFTTRLPMGSDRSSSALTVEGRPDDGRTPPNRQVKIISPGMFRTLGTSLAAGRDFIWSDLYDKRNVAIVSENLARELWGSPQAALGKLVREYYAARSPWHEIVGVAGDVYDDGASQPPPATVYWPAQPDERFLAAAGYHSRRVSVAIRTHPRQGDGGPSELAGMERLLSQLREAVWSVSADLPIAQVHTLDEVYGESMARASFTLVLLAIAGSMALMLGVAGLYGVVAYAVSQRRREIAIRVALGAQPGEIRRLFLRRGLIVVGVGVAIGLAGAAGLSRLMQSLLFGIGPLDPIAFTAMPLVLAAAALLASYLPARRAIVVDPIETLRTE